MIWYSLWPLVSSGMTRQPLLKLLVISRIAGELTSAVISSESTVILLTDTVPGSIEPAGRIAGSLSRITRSVGMNPGEVSSLRTLSRPVASE